MDNMAQRLQQYITTELTDAAYYRELARSAPNDSDYQLLLNMADNEQVQAESFKKLYRSITGRNCNAAAAPLSFSGSYEDALRERALSESADCRAYADQYLAAQNPAYKRACFCANANANMHCQLLLCMLTQEEGVSPASRSTLENS